ncbi:dihydrodipicolinate synthase family protein [Microbacterium enclense]|uniref:Dihydrodipicolinate synthase family protein n=1 Tax=Microbacterium enclense TaxID=993073 RepID=A0A3S3MAP2_9MICO|nr:dihydrodipicolinate synthase family protein [Microbacterium enclense]RWR16682.1 dihydrodipicolinate synthase family protein [Microbacterium enclense]
MSRRDIVTAIPTSFRRDGALDVEGSREIFRYVARSGNEGAFVLGTTGEFPAVDDEEFRTLVSMAVEELSGHLRVIAHVGQPSAYEAVRRVRTARDLGVTEFAALTPYYLPAADEAVYDYFAQVADAVGDGSLYVYVYPKRSGIPVSPALLARLAELPAVVGAKVSELSLAELAAYRAVVPEDFVLYTGADRELVAAGESGAQGVVSGVSSVLPKPFRELARAADAGDEDALARAQAAVDDIVAVIGGDMARMKAAYRIMGVADGVCRMALVEPDGATITEIERVVATYR